MNSSNPTIRFAAAQDATDLMQVASETGLFAPDELAGFTEMTQAYFQEPAAGHHWLALETDHMMGAAYVVPEQMAEDVWNLLFIGLRPYAQGNGHGTRLLEKVEELAKTEGARLLLIETASGDDFIPTREFYTKRGYDQEAVIRDYYGVGVDKIVFRKAL